MMYFRSLGRAFALPVAFAMLFLSFPIGVAQAEFITTDEVIGVSTPDRAQIEGFLARADVKRQLSVFGVNPAEAQARVASLSDVEASRLAGQIGTLPAGEGGLIIGILFFAIMAMLISEVSGQTDFFPNIGPLATE